MWVSYSGKTYGLGPYDGRSIRPTRTQGSIGHEEDGNPSDLGSEETQFNSEVPDERRSGFESRLAVLKSGISP